jgi:hypothetical protein
MVRLLTILLLFALVSVRAQEKIYVSINDKPITFNGAALYFGLDADAERYIDTVLFTGGTLTTEDISNIDYTVRALKKTGVWNQIQALYPLMGGKPVPASFNLRNVATFQISWTNVDSTMLDGLGWQNDGAGHGNTNYTPSVSAELNNAMMGSYSYLNIAEGIFHMGVRAGTNKEWAFNNRNTTGNASLRMYKSTVTQAANASSQGLSIIQRNSDDFAGHYFNSVLIVSTTTPGGALPDLPVFIGGSNEGGVAGLQTTNKYGFFVIGRFLTDVQRASFRTIMTYFISRRTP